MFSFFKRKEKVEMVYGDYIQFTKGFYTGYIGRIVANKIGSKYLIRLQGKNPVYPNSDFNESVWEYAKKFKKLDIEVEKVKEDFWSSIKPKESKKIFNPLTASVKYNSTTNTFDMIEHV